MAASFGLPVFGEIAVVHEGRVVTPATPYRKGPFVLFRHPLRGYHARKTQGARIIPAIGHCIAR